MQSRIIVNPCIERRALFTTRYANLWTRIFQKKRKKPLASEVSVPLDFSWINPAAPLIISCLVSFFLYRPERDLFSGDRAHFPQTLSYVTIHARVTLCVFPFPRHYTRSHDRDKLANLPSRTENHFEYIYCVYVCVSYRLHKLQITSRALDKTCDVTFIWRNSIYIFLFL